MLKDEHNWGLKVRGGDVLKLRAFHYPSKRWRWINPFNGGVITEALQIKLPQDFEDRAFLVQYGSNNQFLGISRDYGVSIGGLEDTTEALSVYPNDMVDTASALIIYDKDFNESFKVRADGKIIVTLPTVNPNVAGQLWNDSGTVKVSSG